MGLHSSEITMGILLYLLLFGSHLNVKTEVQKLLVKMEIMDEREIGKIFEKSTDFNLDFQMIAKRYEDLKDAPKLWTKHLFAVHPDICDYNKTFNRKHQLYLETLSETYPDKDFTQWKKETKLLLEFWDNLRDAQTEYYFTHTRRLSLKRVAEILGEDFWTGYLPPAVPGWRFSYLRSDFYKEPLINLEVLKGYFFLPVF